MSKREVTIRQQAIITKLQKKPASFVEIAAYLDEQSRLHSYNLYCCKRTFQRDIADIKSIYKMEIKWDPSKKAYFINQEQEPEVNERIFEAFDIFNALNLSESLSNHIHFQKRGPQGTEHLLGLLHAIKNQKQIGFSYQKYWEKELTERVAEPYALKEFKNRWYLLANDLKDSQIKSFALDRISDLEISNKAFGKLKDFDVRKHYQYCFGIISPNGHQPEEVILSFDHFQGKYIKSLPLHSSQEVLVDNEEELRIKLTIFLTHDFFMELLSYGEQVQVLAPSSLVEELKQAYQNALNLY